MNQLRGEAERRLDEGSRSERRPQHPKISRAIRPGIGVQKASVEHLEPLRIGARLPHLEGGLFRVAQCPAVQLKPLEHLFPACLPVVFVGQQHVRTLPGPKQPQTGQGCFLQGHAVMGTCEVVHAPVVFPNGRRFHHVLAL